jgi:hypothetical protein
VVVVVGVVVTGDGKQQLELHGGLHRVGQHRVGHVDGAAGGADGVGQCLVVLILVVVAVPEQRAIGSIAVAIVGINFNEEAPVG